MSGRRRQGVVALAFAVSAVSLMAGPQGTQRPLFKTDLDIVTTEVSVHQGNLAVAGLTANDFIVTDNGVPQEVDAVSGEALPIDLTLVIDASGSTEPFMDQIKTNAREVTAMLRDDDRMRVISFTSVVAQMSPFQPASEPLDLERQPPLGLTSIYDAVAAAMMRTRVPDRHELIVVFTDGFDSSSTIGGPAVLDVARRSDAILHVFIVWPTPLPNLAVAAAHTNRNRLFWVQFRGDSEDVSRIWLDDAATTTGGELQDIFGEAHVPGGLKTAIDDMRASYILRYTATNVARPGWHDINVKLKRDGNYSVRARKGYFGGGS
jgi:VWFA-related protein